LRAESMSAIERMECAIALEKPDRVPIWPDVTTSAAAGLTGQKPPWAPVGEVLLSVAVTVALYKALADWIAEP